MKDAKGHGSDSRGDSGPASYQNVSTKPLLTNAAQARLAAARSNLSHPLGALTNAVSGAVARGTATPIAGIPAHSQGVAAVGQPPAAEKASWSTFAPGTGARNPNVNSYSARTNVGEYHIDPPQNGGRSGWSLQHADTQGVRATTGGSPGLWQHVGTYSHPNQAKAAAQAHMNTLRTKAS